MISGCRVVLALLLLLSWGGQEVLAGFDCAHFNSNMGATFDLSELQRCVRFGIFY